VIYQMVLFPIIPKTDFNVAIFLKLSISKVVWLCDG